jgi:hypothetical protein
MRRAMFSAAGLLVLVLAALASISTSSRAAGETLVTNIFITAYTWQDNTPPGSPEISNPVLHAQAGGTGTYEDPVTIAVGHSRATGQDVLDLPAGTRIYLPDVRRYFIVEDTCGDGPTPENGPCHTGAQEQGNASLWIDMWIGGSGQGASFVNACTSAVTGVRSGLLNPAPNYAVASGAGVIHDGKCDAGYGNGLAGR